MNLVESTQQNLKNQFENITIPKHLVIDVKETIFNVEKRPVPFIGIKKDIFKNPVVKGESWEADFNKTTNKSMIVNSDKESFISIVSNEYTVVPNIKILNAINEMQSPYNQKEYLGLELIEVSIFNDSRTKYVFLAKNLERTIFNEKIVPRLTIINSYSGDSSVKIIGGVNVLVCTNGLMFPKTITQYNRLHKGEIEIENLFSKFIATIKKTNKFAESSFSLLKSVSYHSEFLAETIGMFNRNVQKDFVKVLDNDKENRKNYYGLLQAGTNIITHKMDRNKESTHNLEAQFIPKLIEIVNKDKKEYNNQRIEA